MDVSKLIADAGCINDTTELRSALSALQAENERLKHDADMLRIKVFGLKRELAASEAARAFLQKHTPEPTHD